MWSAAIGKPTAGPANGKVYTPDEWNTESTLETGAYRFSKVRNLLRHLRAVRIWRGHSLASFCTSGISQCLQAETSVQMPLGFWSHAS